MTDKEKQIEEMAMSIAECNGTTCDNCRLKCSKYITCKILYDKGYRKMDEITLKLDLGDRSAEEIKQIAEAFNGDIKKQVAKEIYDLIGLIPIPDKHGTHLHIGFENALSAVKIKIAEEYGVGN